MPKKRVSKKKTTQKQRQSQSQKIVVNIGQTKKSTRKRAPRKPKEPSQEAQEYAESISRIIPKIQYNFPQHSSFNYDAYQTPNLVPIPKPVEVQNPVAITAPEKKGDLLTLSQELAESPKLTIMDDKPYTHNEMDLNKPVTSGNYKDPILGRPKYDPFYQGITEVKSSRKTQTDIMKDEEVEPMYEMKPQIKKRIPILSDVVGESINIESTPDVEKMRLKLNSKGVSGINDLYERLGGKKIPSKIHGKAPTKSEKIDLIFNSFTPDEIKNKLN